MHVLTRPVGRRSAPELVFRRLVARAHELGLPPPAALSGDWFGARAVLLPSVQVNPVADEVAHTVPCLQPTVTGPVPPGTVGGGWFGFLGYGLTDPGVWTAPRGLPNAVWGWADHVLRLDHGGQWWFEALVPDNRAEPVALAAELAELVAASTEPARRPWRAGPLRRASAARHRAAVAGCVEQIAAGEIFQANVCTQFTAEFDGDPAELFAEGVARLDPARAAYLAGDWGAVVSFSPELFLARHGRTVRSSPIKGTLPRRGPEDEGNAARLRRSVKDVAENVMIVDLVRNDLGRVCVPGSVTVPELLKIRPAPGVWHLVSTVEGQLRPAVDDAELLGATFPPGSVTGAPKVRALELIAGLEDQPRQVYCGAVGLASPVAGMELNVAIRTLEIRDGELRLGVGGGITADSDPQAEWLECLAKAAPLERLLTSGAAVACSVNQRAR
ncbi:aminodeoxychorismate synthase component I [Crossiella sp. CA-258035]|uniref:aminodeoxychorismate synthase component I n=1 Tax=Crossiella sp. CA-258035 TaxID=2981138 RepID=UPI0024BD08E8|nr:aminodeoxychorismate synthase component I [Crossiella sp. CA-258035]WHT18775.1 aminodeoxychorismate synthase component I [Crossiella sp. CA-258035]